jgi:hypothetical protein
MYDNVDFYDSDDDIFVYKIVKSKDVKTEPIISTIPEAEYYFWYNLETSPIYNSVFLYDTPLNSLENIDDILHEPFFLPETHANMPSSSSLSSCKMLNVKETNIRDFLSKILPHLIDSKFITIYSHLTKAVQLLGEKQMIHMGIHENNIVVDQHTHNSYICEYEHSFLSKPTFTKITAEWFHLFPECDIATTNYPFDIILLSFILKNILRDDMNMMKTPIQESNLKELKVICSFYFKHNSLFSPTLRLGESLHSLFFKEDIRLLKENWNQCFKSFLHKPWQHLIYHIIEKSYTWDMFALRSIFYQLSVTFLRNPDVINSFQMYLKEKLLQTSLSSIVVPSLSLTTTHDIF